MGRETEAWRAGSEKSPSEIPGEETKSSETDAAVTGFLQADPRAGEHGVSQGGHRKTDLRAALPRETSDVDK